MCCETISVAHRIFWLNKNCMQTFLHLNGNPGFFRFCVVFLGSECSGESKFLNEFKTPNSQKILAKKISFLSLILFLSILEWQPIGQIAINLQKRSVCVDCCPPKDPTALF